MKISKEVIAYITPDKGQSVYELAQEIYAEKQNGKIGDKIFLNLPEGKTISITGETINDIRDSIATQCKPTSF